MCVCGGGDPSTLQPHQGALAMPVCALDYALRPQQSAIACTASSRLLHLLSLHTENGQHAHHASGLYRERKRDEVAVWLTHPVLFSTHNQLIRNQKTSTEGQASRVPYKHRVVGSVSHAHMKLQNRTLPATRGVVFFFFMLAVQLASVCSQRVAVINTPRYHTDVVAGVMHAFKDYFKNNMSHVLFTDHSPGTLDFLEAGMGMRLRANGTLHAMERKVGPQPKFDRARLPAKVDVAVFITPEHESEEGLKVRPLHTHACMHVASLHMCRLCMGKGEALNGGRGLPRSPLRPGAVSSMPPSTAQRAAAGAVDARNQWRGGVVYTTVQHSSTNRHTGPACRLTGVVRFPCLVRALLIAVVHGCS